MKRILVTAILVSIAFAGFAQKISLRGGKLHELKMQKEFEVQFTYNDLKIGKLTEADYIAKRKIEINEKEGDGGERWHQTWLSDRSEKFEYKFKMLFNKYAARDDIRISDKADNAKYIMVVNTYFIEPGFNIGVSAKPAIVSLTVEFVEKANPSNVIAKYDVAKARGDATLEANIRIQEGYARAGKYFGALMGNKLR